MQWEGLRSLDGHLIDTNGLHSQTRASFPPECFLETHTHQASDSETL